MKRALALIGIVALATAWAGEASALSKPFQIGFGGGVSVPMSDAGDALKSGWHGTAIFKLDLPALPVDLGAALSYKRFNLDEATTGIDGVGTILGGLGNMTFSMPFPGPVKPYITAGLGYFNVKADPAQEGIPAPESETKFGIDAGVGLRFGLMGLKGFVEGKFENIYTEQGFSSTVTDNFSTQVVPITFGVYF